MPDKKKISIFTPVYNEERTVLECYERIKEVMAGLSSYDYEHVFGDNGSDDGTLSILREIASRDRRVKVLSYSRNFGAEKSSFTLLKHVTGDAAIGIPADLQEPPSMIPIFVAKWESGYDVVYGVYANRSDSLVLRNVRKLYYWLIDKLTTEPLPKDFSGFGILDRKVIRELVRIDDHAPYIRGLIATIGFRQTSVPYDRAPRKAGLSKHNVAFLIDFAINGIISYSFVPIRLATLAGIVLSGLSIFLSVLYVLVKLLNWSFQAPGATTTIVLILFFSGIQLFFLGILGEYVGAIHSQVRRRPFVIVREKINFEGD
jgi:polyisoprenyl-phosphate glycosyltransferase